MSGGTETDVVAFTGPAGLGPRRGRGELRRLWNSAGYECRGWRVVEEAGAARWATLT